MIALALSGLTLAIWLTLAGGCMLVRREALARAGGLDAIRNELIVTLKSALAWYRDQGGAWKGRYQAGGAAP